jgi:Protein of unknown function (DUF3489)
MNVLTPANPVKGDLHDMTLFTMDPDNHIRAFASAAEARRTPESERFRSAEELKKLAANWPATRLIEIWNGLPGVTPVRKFTSRQTAVKRIWAAIQSLGRSEGALATSGATKRKGSAKRRSAASAGARHGSKAARVVELLKQPGGATLNDLMTCTEWQAHSVRGFLSGTLRKKMGLKVASGKIGEGERTYSIQP